MSKLGIDYHGVITANPVLFAAITTSLRHSGYEIHIITGSRITDALKEQLKLYNISYTHLFSISDYHHSRGTPMSGYEEHQPKIDGETWNRTKALYCEDRRILLHIDDSEIYGKYFTTPYLLFKQTQEEPIFTFVPSSLGNIANEKFAKEYKHFTRVITELTTIVGDLVEEQEIKDDSK